jgi:hypothetical protein
MTWDEEKTTIVSTLREIAEKCPKLSKLCYWKASSIREDLESYKDIDPKIAINVREILLSWIKND